jgi:hypothetical protein
MLAPPRYPSPPSVATETVLALPHAPVIAALRTALSHPVTALSHPVAIVSRANAADPLGPLWPYLPHDDTPPVGHSVPVS